MHPTATGLPLAGPTDSWLPLLAPGAPYCALEAVTAPWLPLVAHGVPYCHLVSSSPLVDLTAPW